MILVDSHHVSEIVNGSYNQTQNKGYTSAPLTVKNVGYNRPIPFSRSNAVQPFQIESIKKVTRIILVLWVTFYESCSHTKRIKYKSDLQYLLEMYSNDIRNGVARRLW